MNTTGPAKVAEDIGLPLLVTAFNRNSHQRILLYAFLLGNWLTDVSQPVDPVAFDDAAKKLKNPRTNIIQLLQELGGWLKGRIEYVPLKEEILGETYVKTTERMEGPPLSVQLPTSLVRLQSEGTLPTRSNTEFH